VSSFRGFVKWKKVKIGTFKVSLAEVMLLATVNYCTVIVIVCAGKKGYSVTDYPFSNFFLHVSRRRPIPLRPSSKWLWRSAGRRNRAASTAGRYPRNRRLRIVQFFPRWFLEFLEKRLLVVEAQQLLLEESPRLEKPPRSEVAEQLLQFVLQLSLEEVLISQTGSAALASATCLLKTGWRTGFFISEL